MVALEVQELQYWEHASSSIVDLGMCVALTIYPSSLVMVMYLAKLLLAEHVCLLYVCVCVHQGKLITFL